MIVNCKNIQNADNKELCYTKKLCYNKKKKQTSDKIKPKLFLKSNVQIFINLNLV